MSKRFEPIVLGLTAIVSTVLLWMTVGMATIYRNYDGPYYVVVAKTWYDKTLIGQGFAFNLPEEYYPAHFPLYPLMIKLGTLFGINYLQAMVGMSLLTAAIGAVVVYWVAEKLAWKNAFWIGLAWLFWWPRMWAVRSVGSPEALFIAAIVLSLYFFQKKKYLVSGIAGSVAVLTKSPGILLLVAYGVWWIVNYLKTKKWEWKVWPVSLIGFTLIGLFYFYYLRTGDFWAYFHTGDNIHLQLLPFRIFDSSQPWVGSFWLEDIIWIYLIGGLGVYRALKKNLVWGIYGVVMFTVLMFVSHRDLSRYSLPLIPVILYGLSEIFDRKEVRWAIVLVIIPLFFYTLNFLNGNTLPVSNWAPLL